MVSFLDDTVRMPMSDLDDAAANAAATLRLVLSNPDRDKVVVLKTASTLERALEADRQRRAAEMLLGSKPPSSDLSTFHNHLRLMHSLDRHELVEAGALRAGDLVGWARFTDDPFSWFIKAADEPRQKLWALILKRGGTA